MNIKSLILVFIAGLYLAACQNKNKNEFEERLSDIQSVKASVSQVKVNEAVSFEALFSASNGCGEFNRFIPAWEDDKTLVVKAYVRYPKEGVCTQAVKSLKESYEFKPTAAGVYTIKFATGENFLEEKITVTE